MKTLIEFSSPNRIAGLISYDPATKTFSASEKIARFDTAYTIKNTKTGGTRDFNFSHSTGPEFDPKTSWVYKSEDGLILEIYNDPTRTKAAAGAYLARKKATATSAPNYERATNQVIR